MNQNKPGKLKPALSVMAMASVLLLNGCANFQGISPQAKLMQAPETAAQNDAAWDAVQWPQRIGGENLAQLIATGLKDNPGIDMARTRISAAATSEALARASTLPSAGLQAESTYQRFTETGMIPPPLGGTWDTNNQVTVGVKYDLDFWGKHQAALKSAISQKAATEAELAAARMSLAAAIASQWVQLNHHAQALELTITQLKLRQRISELSKARAKAGLENQTEIRQNELSESALLQEIQQWKDGIDSAKLQLALLLGKTPDYAASIAVPAAPVQGLTLPPENLPLHLIARKPEIVAARWRVEAADAGIAQAKANFYPDININAFAGLSSLGLDHLLKSGSAIAGAGPVLSLPVFDGGRLRASLSRNVAEYDTAVYSYNQSLQSAFKDAAEQVQSLQKLNEQRKIAESARQSANQLQQLATLRQRAGTGTDLPVLQAEINEVGQKKNLNDIQSKMTLSQIALIRAIGGDLPATN
ncbi:efflux transporter outer membrane subunit [Undibacterium luofuense]|uniref:Efflux transporter outer membrane subunit n=1 Tax=Undibacterium luofuense TaxID=2828733 RepID=A0A941I4T1_9BURK|nr:efflux transporter outer membrane subunit [Undibacterium luofuense]MBR7782037.1 efflux transporter outer membrane subunit [Undibacterium luofuense]